MTSSYYTIKEAAELLQVNPATIYKYIREGKLCPALKGTEKVLCQKELEHIKVQLEKPGMTTGEAAKFLGIHQTSVNHLIKVGILKAEKRVYRGKDMYFIDPCLLDEYKRKYLQKNGRGKKKYIDKDTGYVLFQQFTNSEGNNDNRILLDKKGKMYLHTYKHEQIPLKKIENLGYSNNTVFADTGYITKRGYARFIFPDVNQNLLSVIDLFYKHLGIKNMNIYVDEQDIYVEVKPIFIKEQIPFDLYSYLESHLVIGRLKDALDGFLIESNVEIINAAVPYEIKEKLKDIAKKSNKTMDEIVVNILSDALDE